MAAYNIFDNLPISTLWLCDAPKGGTYRIENQDEKSLHVDILFHIQFIRPNTRTKKERRTLRAILNCAYISKWIEWQLCSLKKSSSGNNNKNWTKAARKGVRFRQIFSDQLYMNPAEIIGTAYIHSFLCAQMNFLKWVL